MLKISKSILLFCAMHTQAHGDIFTLPRITAAEIERERVIVSPLKGIRFSFAWKRTILKCIFMFLRFIVDTFRACTRRGCVRCDTSTRPCNRGHHCSFHPFMHLPYCRQMCQSKMISDSSIMQCFFLCRLAEDWMRTKKPRRTSAFSVFPLFFHPQYRQRLRKRDHSAIQFNYKWWTANWKRFQTANVRLRSRATFHISATA